MRVAFAALALLPACSLAGEVGGAEGERASADQTSCEDTGDVPPDDLACTGFGSSPRIRAYVPGAVLFSDGADKARFLELPEGKNIDASSTEGFRFPVGTKAWKEFVVDGRKVETRFMWKVREDRWVQAAYVWSADGTKAVRGEGTRVELGGGRTHEVPTNAECNDCHKGAYDRLLGFEPVSMSLPGARGLRVADLVREGRIDPPPPQTDLPAPDPALLWLHANCGSCHGARATATAFGTGLRLRIGYDEIVSKPVEAWAALTTSVGVAARTPDFAGETRIVPGDPASSLLVKLARTRGPGQMPTVGSERVDEAGLASVETWIRSLPPRQSSFGPESVERSAPGSASRR